MTSGPRDTEAMRERILEAGAVEFAAYGLAGARVDRIAVTASVNKNSIYRYFPSKDEIFAAVLDRHLERVFVDVPFSPDDLTGFAVRLFDYAMDHPQLMRLVAWSGLERPAKPGKAISPMQDKFTQINALQADGRIVGDVTPAAIFTVISAISAAWTTVNPFWSMIDGGAGTDREALRDMVARLIDRAFIVQDAGREG